MRRNGRRRAAGYTFAFPRDHASHPDYKIEWWYYTGNVSAKDGRRFGYQVTFFRVGVDAAPANPSRWAIRDLFMTHLAVSDPKGRRYRYAEKLTRGGPGLAGAAVDRYHVWNEDWTASLDDSGRHVLQVAIRLARPSRASGRRSLRAGSELISCSIPASRRRSTASTGSARRARRPATRRTTTR